MLVMYPFSSALSLPSSVFVAYVSAAVCMWVDSEPLISVSLFFNAPISSNMVVLTFAFIPLFKAANWAAVKPLLLITYWNSHAVGSYSTFSSFVFV